MTYDEWKAHMGRRVRRYKDWTLDRELGFAETPRDYSAVNEAAWLVCLIEEWQRRHPGLAVEHAR